MALPVQVAMGMGGTFHLPAGIADISAKETSWLRIQIGSSGQGSGSARRRWNFREGVIDTQLRSRQGTNDLPGRSEPRRNDWNDRC